jgi:hypothetical protein
VLCLWTGTATSATNNAKLLTCSSSSFSNIIVVGETYTALLNQTVSGYSDIFIARLAVPPNTTSTTSAMTLSTTGRADNLRPDNGGDSTASTAITVGVIVSLLGLIAVVAVASYIFLRYRRRQKFQVEEP